MLLILMDSTGAALYYLILSLSGMVDRLRLNDKDSIKPYYPVLYSAIPAGYYASPVLNSLDNKASEARCSGT